MLSRLTSHVRNAWLNRCLLCLVYPYHGTCPTDEDREALEEADRAAFEPGGF